MTFLNPFALLGLLAAAIPILLHLLNLRKLRTIEFSTLAFLKELEKTKIRKLKLRQILLLILRTLLIVTLVLAFARPTLRGSLAGELGTNARTSSVLLIDDSFSMTAEDSRGELLKQALGSAKDLTQIYAEGDEVFLLPLSGVGKSDSVGSQSTRDFNLLRKRINSIKSSPVHRPLEGGIRVAARFLATAQNFNKEILAFSDFQDGLFGDVRRNSEATEYLFPEEARFFMVSFGAREIRNYGVESVSIPSSVLEQQKPFTLQGRIRNATDADVQDRVVSVYLNGTRVAERSVDIPRRSSVPVEFSVAADSASYLEGTLELEHDDLEYDNKRFFALRIPERTNVLLVGTPETAQLVRLALTAQGSSMAGIQVNEVRPRQLSSNEIKRSDVIILTGTTDLVGPQISELASFTRSGGGLMIFPSASTDPSRYNAEFSTVVGLPQMKSIDRPSGAAAGAATYIEFDKADLKHPLFEGMFESSAQSSSSLASGRDERPAQALESPRITASANFSPRTESTVLISMTSGSPFLTEQTLGSGRTLVFAVPPTPEWSDFPTRGLFVPLLHRSVLYLAQPQSRIAETAPGSEILIRSSAGSSGPWELKTPQQLTIPVTPTLQLFQQLFRIVGPDQVGIYSLQARGSTIQKFVVNLDPRESLTAKASTERMESLLQRLGIRTSAVRMMDGSDDLNRAVMESRFGKELWKYFVTFALLLAIIELFVARTWKRETMLGTQHD